MADWGIRWLPVLSSGSVVVADERDRRCEALSFVSSLAAMSFNCHGSDSFAVCEQECI